jgi:hypothetical protein
VGLEGGAALTGAVCGDGGGEGMGGGGAASVFMEEAEASVAVAEATGASPVDIGWLAERLRWRMVVVMEVMNTDFFRLPLIGEEGAGEGTNLSLYSAELQ